MDRDDCPPLLASAVRDGFVESRHRGHVAVCDAGGRLLASLGHPHAAVYPRSAVKPFQAAAVLDVLGPEAGMLDDAAIAIAAASHSGSDDHMVEAARVLALADLDEAALQCPPALPTDERALAAGHRPERLAYNCSGKHAAFLLAQVAAGGDPRDYLDPASVVQRAVAARLAALTGATPAGPGVDGCGAPAWRLPLNALAIAFARLAARPPSGDDRALATVAAAMRARPQLVGAPDADDTALMEADPRVVAKRGAEAVFGAGLARDSGIGVAVKIADGGARAAGPVAAAVLAALGADVPPRVVAPPVLGGGRVHGQVEVEAGVARAFARALGA